MAKQKTGSKYGKPKHSGQWKAPKGSRCSKCGKPAAISLRYANMDLCQSHFTEMFESRVKRTVREFHMLKKGDRVAVALSGGKDSIVALHMLHKIRTSLPFELFAISIDEGIGGYRAESIGCARSECKKLGVPLTVISFRQEYGKSLDSLLRQRGEELSCSFCGVMRRRLLNKTARKLRADKLAVGHNADDVAQTVLMNLMRNEPERLARFAPVADAMEGNEGGKFIARMRPLFRTPEIDVVAYAVLKGLSFHHDRCPYSKNAFRERVRFLLNQLEERYPATKTKIVNAFLSQLGLMRDGVLFRVESGKIKPVGKCKNCGEPSSQEICRLCTLLGKKLI